MSEESKLTTTERHLQSVIVIIIVSVLGWVGVTVQQTSVAVARLTVEIEHLKAEVRRPGEKFIEIERRLDKIESTLADIKARQQKE